MTPAARAALEELRRARAPVRVGPGRPITEEAATELVAAGLAYWWARGQLRAREGDR